MGRPLKPVVASIGTTHPWNFAGIGRDIRVIEALGGVALTIVAGVSAQGGGAAPWREPLSPEAIAAQFASLERAPIGAFRIGALLDVASVEAVVAGIASRPAVPVICDPVIVASDGTPLATEATVRALAHSLFVRCTVITPNVPEAEALFGAPLADAPAAIAAADDLRARSGARNLLLKGGHRKGEPVDILACESGAVETFSTNRLAGQRRGTGCVLAAALAYGMAAGMPVRDAVVFARARVRAQWEDAAALESLEAASRAAATAHHT